MPSSFWALLFLAVISQSSGKRHFLSPVTGSMASSLPVWVVRSSRLSKRTGWAQPRGEAALTQPLARKTARRATRRSRWVLCGRGIRAPGRSRRGRGACSAAGGRRRGRGPSARRGARSPRARRPSRWAGSGSARQGMARLQPDSHGSGAGAGGSQARAFWRRAGQQPRPLEKSHEFLLQGREVAAGRRRPGGNDDVLTFDGREGAHDLAQTATHLVAHYRLSHPLRDRVREPCYPYLVRHRADGQEAAAIVPALLKNPVEVGATPQATVARAHHLLPSQGRQVL